MLKKLRRKVYRKIRFQTWYRKAYYYHRKRRDLDKTIAQYRCVDVLSDKKRLYRLRRDMIRSLFRYGSYYNEYFLFGYEGKDADYRDSFITEGVRMSYYPRMNDPKNTNLLENKYLTYQKFRDFYGRDVLRIKKGAQPTPAALEALRNFTQAHPDYIVKPIYAAFGKGVHTESIRDYPYLEAAHAAYSAHGAILEQIIEQGEALIWFESDTVAYGKWYLQDNLIFAEGNPYCGTQIQGSAIYTDKYVKVDGQWLIEDTGYLRVYEESFQRDKTHRIRINMFRPKKKKVIKKK